MRKSYNACRLRSCVVPSLYIVNIFALTLTTFVHVSCHFANACIDLLSTEG